ARPEPGPQRPDVPKVLVSTRPGDWAGLNTTFRQWPMTQASMDRLARIYETLATLRDERLLALERSARDKALRFAADSKPAVPFTNRPADAPPRPARGGRRATVVTGDPVPPAPTVGPGTLWPDSMVL